MNQNDRDIPVIITSTKPAQFSLIIHCLTNKQSKTYTNINVPLSAYFEKEYISTYTIHCMCTLLTFNSLLSDCGKAFFAKNTF